MEHLRRGVAGRGQSLSRSRLLALAPSADVGPLQELARPRGLPFVDRLPVQLAGDLALAVQLLEALEHVTGVLHFVRRGGVAAIDAVDPVRMQAGNPGVEAGPP